MNIRYLPAILIIILFSSCWTTSKFVDRANYDVSKVPSDFDPRKQTLLVCEIYRLNAPKQVNPTRTSEITKALQEYYPYKYEIVSMEDIKENPVKYRDTTKYKYALLYYLNGYTTTTTTTTVRTTAMGRTSTSVSPSARTIFADFGFYDRVLKKAYPSTGNWAPKFRYGIAVFASLVEKAKTQKK